MHFTNHNYPKVPLTIRVPHPVTNFPCQWQRNWEQHLKHPTKQSYLPPLLPAWNPTLLVNVLAQINVQSAYPADRSNVTTLPGHAVLPSLFRGHPPRRRFAHNDRRDSLLLMWHDECDSRSVYQKTINSFELPSSTKSHQTPFVETTSVPLWLPIKKPVGFSSDSLQAFPTKHYW